MSRWAPDLKLGQLPLPSQQVLMLNAGIIHGRLVLDVSLTPLQHHAMWDMTLGMWFAYIVRALVSAGATGAAAPINFGQRVHAPVNFQA